MGAVGKNQISASHIHVVEKGSLKGKMKSLKLESLKLESFHWVEKYPAKSESLFWNREISLELECVAAVGKFWPKLKSKN